MHKRILAMLLAVMLVMGSLSFAVLAQEPDRTPETGQEKTNLGTDNLQPEMPLKFQQNGVAPNADLLSDPLTSLPELNADKKDTTSFNPQGLWRVAPGTVVPGEKAEFQIALPLSAFDHAEIDGIKLILEKDYLAREGSTILTLLETYTQNISEGEHELTLYFKNNEEVRSITNSDVTLEYVTLSSQFETLANSKMSRASGGVIKIGETEYSSLEEAVNAAALGDILTLSGGDMTISTTVKIPAEKNLILDLGQNTLISQVDTSSMLNIIAAPSTAPTGSFTIKNGLMTAEDVNGDGKTGGAVQSTNSNLTVDSIEASQFNKSGNGGVVNVEANKPVKININNCHFHDNSAIGKGGAVSITTYAQESEVALTNNTISNNSVSAQTYSYGGGVSLNGVGTLLIRNNVIENNRASVLKPNPTNSTHYWSHGGGLSITSSGINSGGKNYTVTLEGNTISNNEAQLFGGGLYLYLNQKSGDVLNLESGIFQGNHSGNSGGAIDYSVHGQPTLTLKNVLVSQNKAPQGGGIWACPTARTVSHSTLGGAILENALIERANHSKTGHDIRFEGYDTKIPGILTDNDPTYHRMTVQDRTFLGDLVHWYADDPGNLYEPGDPILTPDMYTDRASSFGLYGEIASAPNWYETHYPEAQLIFINNTAGSRGGAISTNSDIIIGEPEDTELSVIKKWLDNDGTVMSENLPTSVDIRLIREDSEGGTYPLEMVQLNNENNWTHTFRDLPSKGMVNGKVLTFTYRVEEESDIPGFIVRYENSEVAGTVNVINQKNTIEIPVTKVWEDSDNQDGKRPDSVTIKLFADDVDTGKTLVLSEENNWTGVFTDLEEMKAGEKINYRIEEVELGNGYTATITGDATAGFKVTNSKTPETITIEGNKTWKDNDNKDGKRPDSITIRLLKNGKEIDSKIVTEADGWLWQFNDLPKYENGQLIIYTIIEDLVADYTSEIAGNAEDGFSVTNTQKPKEPPKPEKPRHRLPNTGILSDRLVIWINIMVTAVVVVLLIRNRQKKLD